MERDEAISKITDDLKKRYSDLKFIGADSLKHDDTLKEYSIIVKYKVRNEDRATVYYFDESGKILRHFNL
ncbi:hypothetical protein DMB44_02120 [Thermoplasma sp. Kam2015]|uniref:hypothetical protein n=1 Tax=Thermoplasma sp. Kam2015 TaxID=2094122 RepID=UPI000D8148F2|nr:hypothetical protein [Thermoplasma sp. Kam2015]PYB68701.1 hypothetical protein DMB44_02120 [Thermoplasma sp. Kam2015]